MDSFGDAPERISGECEITLARRAFALYERV
jgi:hypothetical protein